MDEWVKQLYKSTNGFGDNNQESRRETVNERRRTNRETAINKRRNIPLNLSPMTPKPPEKVPEEPPKKVNNRLEMLKKWKQEKEKKKLELKKQQKPMFKWSRVEHKDDVNLALNYIKGRKITKEKSYNESIRNSGIPTNKLGNSKTTNSITKKTLTTSSGKYPIRKNCRDETPLVASSEKAHTNQRTTTFKHASGSIKTTNTNNQTTSELKTSARSLKFPGVTPKNLNSDKISKVSGISQAGKAKMVQGYDRSVTATESKSMKKVKTPKKQLKISHEETENGVGESSNYSKENLNSFSKKSVDVSTKNDSFNLPKSSNNKMKTPGKISRNVGIATDVVENEASKIRTPCSLNRRSTRNMKSSPEELLEHNRVNDNSTEQNSAEKGELFRKSLNNSKISTPNIKANDVNVTRRKTPRNSTTKKSSRNSRIHVNIKNCEANVEENSEVLNETFTKSPETDLILVDNRTSSINAKSLRKSFMKSEENKVTLNKSENPIISTESNGISEGKSPIVNLTQIVLNDSEISTLNPNQSQVNVSRTRTPRSSAKKTRTPKVNINEDEEKNSRISRRSILNTPKTDWKLIENESNEMSSKKPRSLRKSLALRMSEKNFVTPSKTDENLSAVSERLGRFSLKTPKSPGYLNNSNSSPITRIKTPRSSNRRRSTMTNIKAEKENKTPQPEIIVSAKSPKSAKKSPEIKRISVGSTPEQENNDLKLMYASEEISDEKMEVQGDTVPMPSSKITSLRRSLVLKSGDSVYFSPMKSPSELNDVFITPEKSNDEPVVYVSPFVTTTRGKAQARQEFEMRKSLNVSNTSFSNHDSAKSPRAAAAYFTRILNTEIDKLNEKRNIWEEYKNTGNLSEDACGLIDMTIGQTNLLISKKFNQFRGLIEKCRTNSESEMRIQCEDLHGFWDMIYKQVNDLNKRFANLQEMKDNNWLEEVPKKKTPKKTTKKKRNRVKSAQTTSSVLKQAILAARKKMVKNGGEANVEICIVEEKPSRDIEKDCTTPGRGILKSQNTRSEKRKTVAFKDLRTSRSASKYTPNQPVRRSLRLNLSGTKLNYE